MSNPESAARAARLEKLYRNPYSGSSVLADHSAEALERDGYTLTVTRRRPNWYAEVNTGAPFHVVSAYGESREEAIQNILARIRTLRASLVPAVEDMDADGRAEHDAEMWHAEPNGAPVIERRAA